MDEAIKESDLVKLDGSIDKLIQNLTELNNAYGSAVESVKKGATSITNSLRSASGATKEGRKAIDDASAAADRLEKAQKELAFAMSETGKQVAWLKAQTVDFNKATVEQQRRIAALTSYHTSLKAEIEDLTSLYQSLTKAEALDIEYGGKVAAEIRTKAAEFKKLNDALKPHIEQLSRLQKAEQELAYLQSEEGQALLEVKKKIKEVTSSRKEEKATIDPLAAAKQKLAALERGEKDAIIATNVEILKKQKLLKLEQEELLAAENSYEAYAVANAKAVAEAKRLDVTLPENAQRFEELKKEIAITGAQMRKFHEELGLAGADMSFKYGFTGLSNSVQQIVRELPAATISLNTFFLAISNNVPIFTDELKRAKIAFDAQVAAINRTAKSAQEAAVEIGKLQKPITQVIKSLFSWQTALVIVLTLLPKYGEAIFNWIGDLLAGENAAKRFSRALKAIRKELKDTDANYGENMVAIRRLADEYSKLSTEAEKAEWIKDNEDKWKELNVAIYDVADAEKFFVENSANVEKAFTQRARAAAAFKLAEEKYSKILQEEAAKNDIVEGGLDPYRKTAEAELKTRGGVANAYNRTGRKLTAEEYQASLEQAITQKAIELQQADLKIRDQRIQKMEDEVDVLVELGIAAENTANAEVGEFEKDSSGKGGKGRDVTKYIESMKVKVTKESEEAITRMQISEFAKRRKEAIATYNEETGKLQNTYNENKRILEGYYKLRKKLSPQQRKDLEDSNAKILETLNTYKSVYNKTLSDIAKDEKIFTTQRAEELVQIRLGAVKKGSNEEYRLREQSIENQRKLAKLENSKLIESERQDETAIDAKYDKQIDDLIAEKNINRLKVVREGIQLQLEAVDEGGKAEYELRKSDIKAQMEMEIAENSRLATEEQMTEEAIRAKYNKQLEDLEYEHQMAMLKIQQDTIKLRISNVQSGSEFELQLMLEQIELERKAAIEANKKLAKDLQQSEDDINQYYNSRANYAKGSSALSDSRTARTLHTAALTRNLTQGRGKPRRQARKEMGMEGSRKREVYEIDTQLLDVNKQLTLYYGNQLNLSEEQVANLKKQKAELEGQRKELAGFRGFINSVAEHGIGGAILESLGFDDEAISAMDEAKNIIIDNLMAIAEAEVEAAEIAVEAAEERTAAAQAAYDAEIEARNNGYANSVDTARKELEDAKKEEAEKQKLLEDAQKKQEAINTITQTSSLITAAAGIWSSMSSIPIVGPALAGTAIAAMFASFIAAKVKAAQVSKQTYGEGGLEFLEGGSHASGNDIPLGTVNSEGKSMVAEGGEAMAIINKRNTKRYKRILPDIIDSLNKGTFEEKFLNAFNSGAALDFYTTRTDQVDLSKLEGDVRKIREQGDSQLHTLPDGTRIVYYKNIKRTIKS